MPTQISQLQGNVVDVVPSGNTAFDNTWHELKTWQNIDPECQTCMDMALYMVTYCTTLALRINTKVNNKVCQENKHLSKASAERFVWKKGIV